MFCHVLHEIYLRIDQCLGIKFNIFFTVLIGGCSLWRPKTTN